MSESQTHSPPDLPSTQNPAATPSDDLPKPPPRGRAAATESSSGIPRTAHAIAGPGPSTDELGASLSLMPPDSVRMTVQSGGPREALAQEHRTKADDSSTQAAPLPEARGGAGEKAENGAAPAPAEAERGGGGRVGGRESAPGALEPEWKDLEQERARVEGMGKEALVEEVLQLQEQLQKLQRDQRVQADFQTNLLKSVGQAVVVSDLSGTITYWNNAAVEIYGWTEAEALGQNIFSVLRPATQSLDELGVEIFGALTQGQKWTGEWSILTKRDTVVDIMVTDTPVMDESNKLVGVIGVSTDITELKRKEAEILRLNAELEARVLERTQQLQESNKLLREEVQEHLCAREHLQKVYKDMEESRAKIMQQAEHLEKLVVELRAARLEAESASRLKSQFLACMSHEIRTPMNAVIGMTNLILSTPLSEEQRQYVETIRTSGDALLSIIDDILDLSKIEAGELALEPRVFSPLMCTEEAIDMVTMKVQDVGLELVTFVEPSVPPLVLSDPYRLRQVLTNLLSNALKFTEKGEIVVRARAIPWAEAQELKYGRGGVCPPSAFSSASCSATESPTVFAPCISASAFSTQPAVSPPHFPGGSSMRLSTAEPTHLLLVSVKDTGIGIPPERMPRLFRPFSQGDSSTTRRFGGTGLGLVISKQLVEMLGGQIWVESEGENRGSTFSFTVALYPADPAGPAGPAATLPANAAASGRPAPKGQGLEAGAGSSKEAAPGGQTLQGADGAVELPERQQSTGLQPSNPVGSTLAAVGGPSASQPGTSSSAPAWQGMVACSTFVGPEAWRPLAPEDPIWVRKVKGLAGRHAFVADSKRSTRAAVCEHLSALGMSVTQCGSMKDLLLLLSGNQGPETGFIANDEQQLQSTGAASFDPDVIIMDTEMPEMFEHRESPLIRFRQGSGTPRPLVTMCPYGGANQMVEQYGLKDARAHYAVITKPVHQTHLTKALLLLLCPAHAASLGLASMPRMQGLEPGQVVSPQMEPAGSGRAAGQEHPPTASRLSGAGVQEPGPGAGLWHGRVEEEEDLEPVRKRARMRQEPGTSNAMQDVGVHDGSSNKRARSDNDGPAGAAPGMIDPANPGQRVGQGPGMKEKQTAQPGQDQHTTSPAPGRQPSLGQGPVVVPGPTPGALVITGPSTSQASGQGLRKGMAETHPLAILLVEDNFVNQRVACRMLNHMGYSVDVAANGLEAIHALEKKQYDLVFMDIQMPVMDGIEATQRIHSMTLLHGSRRPRIVAMTANVLHSDRQQCLNAGMDGFLSKPIRVADLVAALEQTPIATQAPVAQDEQHPEH